MCGGLLDIDIDRQMYICPFCGVTYDYDYFREENVLEIATRALYRGEFGSAKEAYNFILKKDPHNFEALRGLFLCSCKWRSIKNILNKENVVVSSTNQALAFAIDNCPPEQKDMFVNIRDMLAILKEYRMNRTDIYRIEDEIVSAKKRIYAIDVAQNNNSKRFTNFVKDIFGSKREDTIMNPAIAPLAYILILVLIAFIYSCWALGWIILLIAAGCIAAAIIIYNVRKAIINKSLDAARVPVNERLESLKQDLEAKKQHGQDLMEQYHEKSKAVVTDDNKYHKAPENTGDMEEE